MKKNKIDKEIKQDITLTKSYMKYNNVSKIPFIIMLVIISVCLLIMRQV